MLPGTCRGRENRSGLQLTALPTAEAYQDSGDGDFTDLVPRIIANHKVRRLAEQQQQQQRLRQKQGEAAGAGGGAASLSREGEGGGGEGRRGGVEALAAGRGEGGLADDVLLLTSSW